MFSNSCLQNFRLHRRGALSGVEAAVTLLDGGTLENNLIIADSVWIDSSNVADYE